MKLTFRFDLPRSFLCQRNNYNDGIKESIERQTLMFFVFHIRHKLFFLIYFKYKELCIDCSRSVPVVVKV